MTTETSTVSPELSSSSMRNVFNNVSNVFNTDIEPSPEHWGSMKSVLHLLYAPTDIDTACYNLEKAPWSAKIRITTNDIARLLCQRLRLKATVCHGGNECNEHLHDDIPSCVEEGKFKKCIYLSDSNRENPYWSARVTFFASTMHVLRDLGVNDLKCEFVYRAMAQDSENTKQQFCFWYDREHSIVPYDRFDLLKGMNKVDCDPNLMFLAAWESTARE